MPRNPAGGTGGVGASGAAAADSATATGGWARTARPARRAARTRRAHVAATAAGLVRRPRRPPGRSAASCGGASAVQENAATNRGGRGGRGARRRTAAVSCAGGWGVTSERANRPTRVGRRIAWAAPRRGVWARRRVRRGWTVRCEGVGRGIRRVLGGATVLALLSFLWNDQVLPRSNPRLRTLQVDIQRKKPSFTLKEQVINEVVPGHFFLRAARIDPNSNKLKDVTIYDLGDAERRRIISADSGRMAYTPGGRDLYLTLQ